MNNGMMTQYMNGTKHWRLNGRYHRTDGPAVECANGDKAWYINGKLHRTDGPAVELTSGTKSWYIENQYFGHGDIPPVDFTLAVLILHGISE